MDRRVRADLSPASFAPFSPSPMSLSDVAPRRVGTVSSVPHCLVFLFLPMLYPCCPMRTPPATGGFTFKFMKTFKNVKTQLLSRPGHIHALTATRGQEGPYWTARTGTAPPLQLLDSGGLRGAAGPLIPPGNSSRGARSPAGSAAWKSQDSSEGRAGGEGATVWQEAPQTFCEHFKILSLRPPRDGGCCPGGPPGTLPDPPRALPAGGASCTPRPLD